MFNPRNTPISQPTSLRQHLRTQCFDDDPYQGICDLMLNEAYQKVPDHFLDVEHPEHEPNLLPHHVTLQVERVLIDLVNNCNTGPQYEQYIKALRNRYAGIVS